MARDPSPPASVPPPPIVLAAIRIALLLGVLLFGAATLFIQRRGEWTPAASDALASLRIVGFALWAIAIVAVLVLRLRRPARPTAADPSIIGWAIGEAVALFGGVHYFLSGSPVWYINGVMFLVATFVIFPIRHRR